MILSGHGVMFVNDLFKEGAPGESPDAWKRTIIADNVSIGSNATILPVNICAKVVIGRRLSGNKKISLKAAFMPEIRQEKLRDI